MREENQKTQPTYDTETGNRVGGECSHLCDISLIMHRYHIQVEFVGFSPGATVFSSFSSLALSFAN